MSYERVTRVHVISTAGRERAARWYRWMATQPNWVARTAALAFLIVVGLPILALFVLAAMVAIVVFGTLALVHAGLRMVRGGSDGQGRKNVVVRRSRSD